MLKILLLVALVAVLNSCAAVQSDVTRFHVLPPKGSGQTFTIRPVSSGNDLEFGAYAARVASHLQDYGWIQASSQAVDYVVLIEYMMGGSHESQGAVPIMGQTGGGTTFQTGSVSTYGRYGSTYGSFSGSSYSPATYGVVGSVPYSVRMHDRYLNIKVIDRVGRHVFEGRVVSTGTKADIAAVLPQMIDSLFTKFPGESGKTKRIEKPLR